MNYLIKFRIIGTTGSILAESSYRAKNQVNEFMCKARFEDYMRKKHADFGRLEIIEFSEDLPHVRKALGDDLFNSMFGGIFK